MVKKRIFVQVADKSSLFNFIFYIFFMMSVLPIFLFFLFSLISFQFSGMILPLIFATILLIDVKRRNLFALCRDMAVLNLTLWFLFGFFSLLQQFAQNLPSFLTYIILVPYAIISSYMVFYLLSNADRHPDKVLKGGVAVSTMIAIISAINGAVISALETMTEHAEQLIPGNGTTQLIETLTPSFHNPHLAFLLVFILFNIPFVKYFWSMSKKKRSLWLYLIPLVTYFVLAGLWVLLKNSILSPYLP